MDPRTVFLALVLVLVGLGIGYSIAYTTIHPREVTATQRVVEIQTYTQTLVATERVVTRVSVTETLALEWPRRVTDALGRTIVIERPPTRIVSTIPSITEEIFALGAGGRIVGVDSYSNYPPEIVSMVKEGRVVDVGGPWTLDIEKIVRLRPDIVFMCRGVKPHETQFAPKLEEAGVKTFFLRCDAARNDIDVYTDIRLLAQVLGLEESGERLIREIRSRIENVTTVLARLNLTRPRVLVLFGPPSWGLWSAGGDTFINWAISTAGGVNIASRYSGWPQLSYEEILRADPDIVIVSVMGIDPSKVREELAQTPIKDTKAWRNGRVYIVTGEVNDILTRPGPRIGYAVEILAKLFYPEVFGRVSTRDVIVVSERPLLVAVTGR